VDQAQVQVVAVPVDHHQDPVQVHLLGVAVAVLAEALALEEDLVPRI
jgi:hypothetical protein